MTLIWASEFDSYPWFATDSVSGDGAWRTRPVELGGSLASGFSDLAGASYNLPAADLISRGVLAVAGSVMTVKAKRNPGISGVSNAWIGCALSTVTRWTYGYFEWRVALPTPGRGMFPALWMLGDAGEIDVLEVFGASDGCQWLAGIHHGTTAESVHTGNDGTAAFHRYGVDWQADHITFYLDGLPVASASPASVLALRGASLDVRIGYAMDPSFADTAHQSTSTDPASGVEPAMQVDYLRVFSSVPGWPIGSTDPMVPPAR